MSEQVSYLWECRKCGTAHPENLIFCPVCAATEGADNKSVVVATDKNSKVNEAMMGAIGWSLQHAQIKTSDVLGHISQRGFKVASMQALRELPLTVLDEVAGGYIGANRIGATGSGLATGLPGGLAGFAAIPADISALIYFALRTLSGISQAYSFETTSETGQAVQLLVFAHACKLETLKIGHRRLENFALARFLLNNPEPYGKLAKACILKQLAAYLTTDFAKTSWATFLPVVGSVVNGTTNFKFVSDVGKGGKIFYRSLLIALVPDIMRRVTVPIAAPVVRTVEIREFGVGLASGQLQVQLAYPVQNTLAPLVIVCWAGEAGREVAEKLPEYRLATIWLPEINDAAQLQDFLEWLTQTNLKGEAQFDVSKIGLVAFGNTAKIVLDILAATTPTVTRVVLYNPVGPAHAVVTPIPILLHWSNKPTDAVSTPESDDNWASQIKAANAAVPVLIMEYAGIDYDFANPASPDYNPKIARLAWNETLNWLK